MKKTLAGGVWCALATLSPATLAVEFGPATTLSPLQAPLDARISLLAVDNLRVEDISAAVAEPAAFSALGLAWSPLLSDVEVIPVRQNGRTFLRLSGARAVDTPWLDVLITLTTPSGRQTQMVTLLFDPVDYLPGTTDTGLAATPAPVSSPSQPAPASALSSNAPWDAPTASSTGTSSTGTSSPGASHATVARGDTLWNIALRTRPPGVDVQQMVIALADANPAAFESGGIDTLRVGQRLEIPGREQALRLSPQQAAQAVTARSAAIQAPGIESDPPPASSSQMAQNAPLEEPADSAERLPTEAPAPSERSPATDAPLMAESAGEEEREEVAGDGGELVEALALMNDLASETPSREVTPQSIEAALAVSGEPIPDGRAWANSPLSTDVLGQVLASLSPFATVEAAPTESEYRAMLDEQARQAAEIESLTLEVAELRQALDEVRALASTPAQTPTTQTLSGAAAPDAPAPSTAAQSSAREVSLGPLALLREHWVWPVGLGLALLLAAMVISRKRRERQWEPAPVAAPSPVSPDASARPAPAGPARAEPTVKPAAPASAAPVEPTKAPAPEAAHQPEPPAAVPPAAVEEPAPTNVSLGEKERAREAQEPPTFHAITEAPVPQTLALERRALSGQARVRPAPSEWEEGGASMASSVGEPAPATAEEEEALALAPQKPARPPNHTIDYRPESLTTTDEAPSAPSEYPPPVAETPASSPEWEIEEVAFKPRRRDNG
ncbi:FimV/HubP family polar landmark protein [Halomonas sp. GD1P12]|uniref:FimV/HubP family polar landmark protein n=1 Tax=Halomonas sp. GD1P12 TaxID=2982691 RepID=UPI0021E48BE5|nr:FimV/HubP family polar landmark protein [Halomonas sp. GD1P12]UYG01370.1 LysM peptidoglycan-binding domain-containing protein [Halomonas sp. GD1P12]